MYRTAPEHPAAVGAAGPSLDAALPKPPYADPADDLHPILARRSSPRSFADAPVADGALRSVLEAARWSASSLNRQPWRFVVGRSGGRTHRLLVDSLARGNQRWAPQAPVLVAAFAEAAGEDGSPSRYATYDLGLAVGQLVLQAEAHGLKAHQIGGFDRDAVRSSFAVPDRFEPTVLVALGYPGPAEALPADLQTRETAPRQRRPLSESVFSEGWGVSAGL